MKQWNRVSFVYLIDSARIQITRKLTCLLEFHWMRADPRRHWQASSRSRIALERDERSLPRHQKILPCIQPIDKQVISELTRKAGDGGTSSPQRSSSPCLSFSLSQMCKNWDIPWYLTWSAYFLPSGQARGVPRESNPMVKWRQQG